MIYKFNEFLNESNSYNRKTIEDDEWKLFIQYEIPYGNTKLYLYLKYFKELGGIKADFDKYDFSIYENFRKDHLDLFTLFKDLILEFREETNAKFIVIQSKGTRETMYENLLKTFDLKEFNTMTLIDHELKEGKKWFYLIDKQYDTEELREYIEDVWRKTVEYQKTILKN